MTGRRCPPLSRDDNAYRMTLYKLRHSDRSIAKLCGVDWTAIYQWRRRRKLPPVHSFGEPTTGKLLIGQAADDARMKAYRRGWSDAKIAQHVGRSASAILAWRRRRGLEANNHRDWERPAVSIVSLDAPMPSGLAIHDRVADDDAAAWLASMGATVC